MKLSKMNKCVLDLVTKKIIYVKRVSQGYAWILITRDRGAKTCNTLKSILTEKDTLEFIYRKSI